MIAGCFVTGTDTEVGKTWISAGLLRAISRRGVPVAAMKPVASGCARTDLGLRNADALQLMEQATVALPYEHVNPYAFEPPVAPHIAAREAGASIETGRIRMLAAEAGERGFLVVEGVGGWAVPLDGTGTVADLAEGLGLPVVLVVGMRLGCLSHALLTVEAIARRGLPLAGWVANVVDPAMDRLESNIESLDQRLDAPRLGIVPYMDMFDAGAVADSLDVAALVGGR